MNVLHGTLTSGLDEPGNQFWYQGFNGVQESAEMEDRFGQARESADFNRDGFSDLAVGAWGEDLNAFTDAGAVSVLYGTSCGGLKATPGSCGSNPDDQLFTQDTLGIRDCTGIAETSEEMDNFGRALAAGDFDGDGYSDLAIASDGELIGADDNVGAVFVLYGSESGLTGTGPEIHFWAQGSGCGLQDENGPEAGDSFGLAVAAGNFDGDQFADLAVGAPFEDDDLSPDDNIGQVSVIYGSASGLQKGPPTGREDLVITQDSATLSTDDTAEPLDQFGRDLVAGDFGGDGADDLAIGARTEDIENPPPTKADAGAATVLSGIPNQGITLGTGKFLHQNLSLADSENAEAGDDFGRALAAGDFNGNGFEDLVIGVDEEDVGAITNAGAVHVLNGSATGITLIGNIYFTQNDMDGATDGGAETNDEFGKNLQVGDFDGNGFVDLAVGSWREALVAPCGEPGTICQAGIVEEAYGSASGLNIAGAQYWDQDVINNPSDAGGADAFDRFGWFG